MADGSLNLTNVGLIAPHLTPATANGMFEQVRQKSKREVELLVAALRPLPDVSPSVRRLPPPRSHTALASAGKEGCGPAAEGWPSSTAAMAARTETPPRPAPMLAPAASTPPRMAPVVTPLSTERYKLQVTITAETHAKLQRIRDLTRHTNPAGDLAVILDRAITMLLEQVERQKLASATRPRSAAHASSCTRHIPAGVKRAVWTRDEGCCAFVGADGRRCGERAFLEFHHVVPYADGGVANIASISLRCRAHNGLEADLWSGDGWALREPPAVYARDRALRRSR